MPRLPSVFLAAALSSAGTLAAAAECGGQIQMDPERSTGAVAATMVGGEPCVYTLPVRPGRWLTADLLNGIGLQLSIAQADGQVFGATPVQLHEPGNVTVRVSPQTAAASGVAPLDAPPQRGFTLRLKWSDAPPGSPGPRPAARPAARSAAATPPTAAAGARPAARSATAVPTTVSPPTPVPVTTPAPVQAGDPAAITTVPVTPLPVPDGCPANNLLNRGVNRVAGVVRGDTICRFTIPAGVGRRVTLTDRADSADSVQLVLYSAVSVPMTPNAAVDLPTGQQELRVLKKAGTAQSAAGPLPFDLSIRLD
ncbi:hypothetical protein [uncultured Paracoccus sp.]|uniref:hypothetical protein n=1 Tax=uncultured Paracoccus sp. TaxID=189685 RepID=UPI002619ADAE|nr:hypothetical protein [uncultured Paracoccus sp.]